MALIKFKEPKELLAETKVSVKSSLQKVFQVINRSHKFQEKELWQTKRIAIEQHSEDDDSNDGDDN